eukprot:812881-Rhodomonas_salina.1
MEELAAVIKDYKGAKIIKQEPNYLYAEFERDFAFVDDVEFLFSPNGQTVEYRSAARKSKKSVRLCLFASARLCVGLSYWNASSEL